jgi:hypothetical protein
MMKAGHIFSARCNDTSYGILVLVVLWVNRYLGKTGLALVTFIEIIISKIFPNWIACSALNGSLDTPEGNFLKKARCQLCA